MIYLLLWIQHGKAVIGGHKNIQKSNLQKTDAFPGLHSVDFGVYQINQLVLGSAPLLLHHKRKLLQFYSSLSRTVLLLIAAVNRHQFQQLYRRPGMRLLEFLHLDLQFVERESARLEDVELEHIASLSEGSGDEDHSEQVLQFDEGFREKLLMVVGQEGVQWHLHIVLQVVQRPRSSQSLERLEQLIDSASAQGPQVGETLLGQLSRRGFLAYVNEGAALLLTDVPEGPDFSDCLIV